MPGSDLRVPLAPILAAFGLAIAVTRPHPFDDVIATTGVWVPEPLDEAWPIDSDLPRRDPRKVLAIPRDVIETMPRGTTILAAEVLGGPVRNWETDGFDRPVRSDEWRVILKRIADP